MLKRLPFNLEEKRIKELDYIIQKLKLLGLLPKDTNRTDVITGLIKEFIRSNTRRLSGTDVYEVSNLYENQSKELEKSIC